MPADMRVSPWTNTRNRQDFSEELFLNVTFNHNLRYALHEYDPQRILNLAMFRVTVNTTAGYFELPNYMNGQLPGPLLDNLTGQLCGSDCVPQGNLP